MDPQRIAEELRSQLRERPYWTIAAIVGVGWVLGRSLPPRAVLAVAGIGVRAAMAAALEGVVTDRMRPQAARNPVQSPGCGTSLALHHPCSRVTVPGRAQRLFQTRWAL